MKYSWEQGYVENFATLHYDTEKAELVGEVEKGTVGFRFICEEFVKYHNEDVAEIHIWELPERDTTLLIFFFTDDTIELWDVDELRCVDNFELTD